MVHSVTIAHFSIIASLIATTIAHWVAVESLKHRWQSSKFNYEKIIIIWLKLPYCKLGMRESQSRADEEVGVIRSGVLNNDLGTDTL